jgi:hypothetical protein
MHSLLPLGAFWAVWSFLTAAALISTAWIFRSSASPAVSEQNSPRETRFDWSRGTIISVALLAIFLGAYSVMILAWEDFSSYDEAELTGFSVRGADLPPMILPEEGRFYPLSLQEFNVIRHVTTTPAGYHAFSIAEVVALALILLVLDDRLRIPGRVVLTGLALFTPAVIVSFMGLVFAERSIVLLLVCLAIAVKLFERTRSAWWAAAAVLSSQVMLYLKETVFLLLLGFAAARLILRCRNSASAGWDFSRLRDQESRLDLCIVAVSLAFLAFYALMIFPHTGAGYLAAEHTSLAETVSFYMSHDPLAWVFAVVVAARAYSIFRRRVTPQLLWDGLAFGGVVYFGAYLGMRMARNYYLAPVDFIAVLYLGHLLFSSWGRMRPHVRIAAATLAAAILYLNVSLSVARIFERKYVVHEKVELARVILERYQRDPRLVRGLYFPFADAWVAGDFLAYLNYRGLPVEQVSGESMGGGDVQIAGGKTDKDGRCWRYANFACRPSDALEPGSLVVVLPDDNVLPAEKNLYLKSAQTLLSYDPGAHVPTLLRKSLKRLHCRSVLRSIDSLPTVYVGAWK